MCRGQDPAIGDQRSSPGSSEAADRRISLAKSSVLGVRLVVADENGVEGSARGENKANQQLANERRRPAHPPSLALPRELIVKT
jgi:hypothetical protein